ncbi:MAG: dienelactone hydrolase family protein [Spirochaetales bacterium]|nr:dienelactone hydrolase family protein [Spirochaetales bacterium]
MSIHDNSIEVTSKEKVNYRLFLPKSYQDNEESKWPLILYLHGAGERGTDQIKLRKYGLFPFIESKADFPFVVLAPLCPKGEVWDFQYKNIMNLLDQIQTDYSIDSNRIYLTGMSMGGQATWNFAIYNPSRFAAIAPVCGCIASPNTCKKLSKVPIWTFHGKKDQAIPFEETQKIVDILSPLNPNLKFSVYEVNGHEVCTMAYEDLDLYEWLLEQKKNLIE